MKTYAYYPGCSLETVGAAYHVSAVETAARLGATLTEIDDWNCCGATAYSHVDELLAQVLCARNLALAEGGGSTDVVAPCSGCFKNLYFANVHMQDDPDLLDHMNYALEEDSLNYAGSLNVHHLLDFFVEEVGLETIREKVTTPMTDLRVAAYYGCQLTRPRRRGQGIADVEAPHAFEDLVEATGATAVPFPYRLHCCGASLIVTSRKAALAMLRSILSSALEASADVIATACPLCQVNLEVYQSEVNHEYGTDFAVPIMYFTQLLSLALGSSPKQAGIGREVVPLTPVVACAARAGG
jgi:heterodisulfide reductase subunit B